MQTLRHQYHQAEQSEQTRRRTLNRPYAPMPLRFQTQMRPDLLKGHLDVPPAHIEADDLFGEERAVVDVGAEEGCKMHSHFARTLVGLLVTYQHPANGYRVLSWGVPQTDPRAIPNL